MRDLRQYWQEVRALANTLPKFVWLMSLEDPRRGMVGGRMAEVGAEQAAPLLHAASHRRATEEEIAAHLEKEERVRRQTFHDGLRKRGIAVVAVASDSPTDKGGKRAPAKRR
jgi:hypothetical protein